jgi:hypothetical protein
MVGIYGPKEERLARLAAKYAGDPVAERVLRRAADEIATYRKYGAYYGYAFLVIGPSG